MKGERRGGGVGAVAADRPCICAERGSGAAAHGHFQNRFHQDVVYSACILLLQEIKKK
jgi:hypothetical protein